MTIRLLIILAILTISLSATPREASKDLQKSTTSEVTEQQNEDTNKESEERDELMGLYMRIVEVTEGNEPSGGWDC